MRIPIYPKFCWCVSVTTDTSAPDANAASAALDTAIDALDTATAPPLITDADSVAVTDTPPDDDTSSDDTLVTLTATGDIVQSSTMSPDKPKAKAIQDGENEGDVCPLRTYAPGFLVKKIGQDSKLAGEDNVLTVTLRSNVDFTSAASGLYAVVTISGLTGSSTPDTTTVADLTDSKFVVANQFTPDFSSVAWNRASGTLLLTIEAGTVCAAPTLLGDVSDGAGTDNTCMKAGSQYVFSVKLGNGATAQAAPIVRISVLYGTSEQKNTAVQVCAKPLSGVNCVCFSKCISRDRRLHSSYCNRSWMLPQT